MRGIGRLDSRSLGRDRGARGRGRAPRSGGDRDRTGRDVRPGRMAFHVRGGFSGVGRLGRGIGGLLGDRDEQSGGHNPGAAIRRPSLPRRDDPRGGRSFLDRLHRIARGADGGPRRPCRVLCQRDVGLGYAGDECAVSAVSGLRCLAVRGAGRDGFAGRVVADRIGPVPPGDHPLGAGVGARGSRGAPGGSAHRRRRLALPGDPGVVLRHGNEPCDRGQREQPRPDHRHPRSRALLARRAAEVVLDRRHAGRRLVLRAWDRPRCARR